MKNQEKTTEIKNFFLKWSFLKDFIIICFVTFGILYLFGFVPNELKINDIRYPPKGPILENNSIIEGTTSIKEKDKPTEVKIIGELPMRIKIDAIGIDTSIYNPETTDIKIMDEYLLRGAVRYPGSGLLGVGNIFLFGHSTGYKVVNNQAYKTFNGLGKLKVGDEIIVYSSNAKYIYSVTNIEMKTASKIEVDFSNIKNMLTLSTCNVFGEKEDRYIVEAIFVTKD
jgi:LPXTG-site transpeptidase (sortase) family protein